MAITNTMMYSGSEPSCLLHPLPKITTWEFHYIHPEYSRVVLQRLTTQTFLVSKANQEPHLVLQAHQEPHLVLQAHQEPQLVSKAHQQPHLVSRLTKNLIQEIKNKCN